MSRKLRPATPSKRAEVYYRKELLSLIALMEEVTLTELKRETVLDAPMSKREEISLAKKLERIQNRLLALNVNRFARLTAIGFLSRINSQNKIQFQRNIENTVGIDISNVLNDDQVELALESSIQSNVNLIKSIQTEYIERIGKVIQENIFSGERSTNLITQIKEQGSVTESRAKFIARDQKSKANADLSQLRAEKLGIKKYIWSGSKDERERESHRVLEGMLCRYDDATVYSDDDGKTWKKRSAIGGVEKHPGEDYQCRCLGIAKISFD